MTQEELLKALKGGSGRKETQVDFGQVGLRPTIQRGGQYNVQVQQAPQTNPALQLADALKGGSQLLGQFVDIQTKQGEIEANALSPQEVIKRVESGDPEAVSFLDKLGKEKAFVETSYKRYFNSTVQPQLTALAQDLQSKPVHEYADQGITTADDFKIYTEGRIKELTDKFGQYTDKSPYAKILHNRLIEEVVPDLTQRQVSAFDQNVTKYNKEEAVRNLIKPDKNNGFPLEPRPAGGAVQFNAPDGTRITDFGQRGEQKTGKGKDPYLDDNSAFAIGFKVPLEEQKKIKAGKPSVHKMKAGDIALSPDVRKILEDQGVQYMDNISVTLDDGTVHTGRWMDVTSDTLTGRVDVYTPEGANPLRDRKVTQVGVATETDANNRVNRLNSIMEANDQSLAVNKFSPAERSEILRRESLLQVETLSTQGKITESRRLLESLKEAKVANQALFGSTAGALEYAKMEEAVDREEERLSFENEKTSKNKIETIAANHTLAMRQRYAKGDDPDAVLKDASVKIMDDPELTPKEKEQVLRSVDTLASNQSSLEHTKLTRGDAKINQAQTEGGSTMVFNNIMGIAKNSDSAQSYLAANDPNVASMALITKADGFTKAVNPAFFAVADDTLGSLYPIYNAKNRDYTDKISLGESFEYNGVKFEGSPDKNNQQGLHMKLAEVFKQDFSDAVNKELKQRLETHPAFQKEQEATQTPAAKVIQDQIKSVVNVTGMKEEDARKLVIADSVKASKSKSLFDSSGNQRKTMGVFDSRSGFIANFVADQDAGRAIDKVANAETWKNVKHYWTAESKAVAVNLVSESSTLKDKMDAATKLDDGFQRVGIPWEAVQSGVLKVEYQKRPGMAPTSTIIRSATGEVITKYLPITNFFNAPNSESKYQIIPAYLMRQLDNPQAKAEVQKVADARYGGDYNRLVKGQQAWYEKNNIEISK